MKHSNTTKTVIPPSVPTISKAESRPLILEKEKFNKEKIIEMVANNKISTLAIIKNKPKNRTKSSIKSLIRCSATKEESSRNTQASSKTL